MERRRRTSSREFPHSLRVLSCPRYLAGKTKVHFDLLSSTEWTVRNDLVVDDVHELRPSCGWHSSSELPCPSSTMADDKTERSSLLDAQDPLFAAEQRRVRRLCASLVLMSVLLGSTCAVVVWQASQRRRISLSKQALHILNDGSHHLPPGCETTLLLLRHCEKVGPWVPDPDGTQHCSYLGYERSRYLATLFGTRWPQPTHLFAYTPQRDHHVNFREWETLKPLSDQTGVTIELAEHPQFATTYFDLLQSGDMCGKVVVASWRHHQLPELAERLGCPNCPSFYADEDFESVWQLKYVYQELPATSMRKEKDDGQRRLKKKNHGWTVYATVTQQNFDPLAYSFQMGDYPAGGTPMGGHWQPGDGL